MVIIHISAGLGNQMFQYALYRQFVAKGVSAKIELSAYRTRGERRDFLLQDVFDFYLPVAKAGELSCMKVYSKLRNKLNGIPYKELPEAFGKFDPAVLNVTVGYMKGYWQSELYFNHIAAELKKDFSFPPFTLERHIVLMRQIKSGNSISVHIRRTDYTEHDGWVLPTAYYHAAMKWMKERVKDCRFFIFSDDLEWAKQHFGEDVFFVEGNRASNSFRDMQLMTHCRHHIIANSSFSWWGAWLNPTEDKIVVAPNRWIPSIKGTGDIIPATWIQLPA